MQSHDKIRSNQQKIKQRNIYKSILILIVASFGFVTKTKENSCLILCKSYIVEYPNHSNCITAPKWTKTIKVIAPHLYMNLFNLY